MPFLPFFTFQEFLLVEIMKIKGFCFVKCCENSYVTKENFPVVIILCRISSTASKFLTNGVKVARLKLRRTIPKLDQLLYCFVTVKSFYLV